MRITRYYEFDKWQVAVGLVGVAILLYIVNVILIRYFIKQKTPEFASSEEVLPDIQKWELTSGLGIVPKWVSVIGLLSISALITACLPWIIALFSNTK